MGEKIEPQPRNPMPLRKLRAIIDEERRLRAQHTEAQAEFKAFLEDSIGQRFLVSGTFHGAIRRVNLERSTNDHLTWRVSPISAAALEPFIQQEMIVSGVKSWLHDGPSVELSYPGDETQRFLARLEDITALEALTEPVPVQQ